MGTVVGCIAMVSVGATSTMARSSSFVVSFSRDATAALLLDWGVSVVTLKPSIMSVLHSDDVVLAIGICNASIKVALVLVSWDVRVGVGEVGGSGEGVVGAVGAAGGGGSGVGIGSVGIGSVGSVGSVGRVGVGVGVGGLFDGGTLFDFSDKGGDRSTAEIPS